MLHTLLTVARVSAVCEKKAIFAICQMAWEHHFDMELVIKVGLYTVQVTSSSRITVLSLGTEMLLIWVLSSFTIGML